ncbi:hypothetical protein FNV43_RR03770 [Rhamnella rubrinervis]|uniref:Serine O-acetyltransferase n=1 Tax=Rhamnella rubrinervis TaxID=2594499 RepID=A0A8K0HKF4_9ROSA|nr:hypothetical protein FNV43_RR03770 [Rhamnella rubrinervis]
MSASSIGSPFIPTHVKTRLSCMPSTQGCPQAVAKRKKGLDHPDPEQVSEVFSVDVHPGEKIGRGILLDHATGVVIGETTVIGGSVLHNVTLGGTGKVSGDSHPNIGDGVLIGAGTCILGSISVGEGAKIGAGSVVLKESSNQVNCSWDPS